MNLSKLRPNAFEMNSSFHKKKNKKNPFGETQQLLCLFADLINRFHTPALPSNNLKKTLLSAKRVQSSIANPIDLPQQRTNWAETEESGNETNVEDRVREAAKNTRVCLTVYRHLLD